MTVRGAREPHSAAFGKRTHTIKTHVDEQEGRTLCWRPLTGGKQEELCQFQTRRLQTRARARDEKVCTQRQRGQFSKTPCDLSGPRA